MFVALIRLIDSPFRAMEEAKKAEQRANQARRDAELGLPTIEGLTGRIKNLEDALLKGRFDISILADSERHWVPRFFVVAGSLQNPTHRYSDGEFTLRQYRQQYLPEHASLNMQPIPDTQIVMQLTVVIYVAPKMLVEQMELELMDVRYPCINWQSESLVADFLRDLEFVIPDSVTPGIHAVRVMARVNGEQRHSAWENINFPER